jgi:quinone-modifying oxidoreductase subunit QmoC
VAGWVTYASWMAGRRFWNLLGDGAPRSGSFLKHLWPVLAEVATHKRFASCETTRPRRLGHLLLLWGFVGAAITSGLLVVAIYLLHTEMPFPLSHPFKILGNVSGVLLVVGGALLVKHRLEGGDRAGKSTAFDTFFLVVVVGVIATGVLSEAGRLLFPAGLACALYVVHLGIVLSLFLTFPYSKFAHLLYRTLALVHVRMVAPAPPGTS